MAKITKFFKKKRVFPDCIVEFLVRIILKGFKWTKKQVKPGMHQRGEKRTILKKLMMVYQFFDTPSTMLKYYDKRVISLLCCNER